ncbi:outer membrane protein assembly factor BamA [Thiomicrorhabdus immobilis]|uniref:outer membrane protein assembly factor BamA n=1 Tax=Thiomicrorhabdus immobilis TaxID=2791037 RepID=UPI001F02DB5B|nr:outer membrane protein assembly factor BamA [Thiomicrorhabdus immobilis]
MSAAIASVLFTPSLAYAFTVKNVEVEGANKIGFETINSYLTVSPGKELNRDQIQESIQRLYKTGFFQDVSFYKRDDGTLVIKVVERPSISEIKIVGNSLIETDVLKTALDGLGIKKGRIYNQVQMDHVVVDLKRRYQNQGYYAAVIDIVTTELPRNRVELKIDIKEGEPATIGRINLVGNKIYSDQRLKSQMQMTENVAFGSGDKYSKPKMEGDIETIKSYYLDRGFAEFKIRSSQVSISADKTKVFTTINMSEGPNYTIADIAYVGELIVEEKELKSLTKVNPGDVFSRSKVIESVNAIRDRLSEEGYAFAEVVPETVLNKENNTVSLAFKVEPKKRVYIRRVEVEGNTRTRDHVIRRELRQYESAPYSLKMVRQSKERLQRVGFFKSTDIETKRVSEDQIDLVVKVEEQPTGSFSAGIGYSQLDGVSFNLGVSERNFIGSGHKLNFNVATSAAKKSADIGVTNPYFTDDGVSLGVGFYYSEIDANELDIADYTTNNMGLRLTLGYPLSENDSLTYGLKLDSQDLVCSDTFSFCSDYVDLNGKSTNSLIASIGWSHNTTNAFYFPSAGQKTSLSLEAVVPSTSDMTYYKLYANESWFQPLSKNFTLQLKTGLAFGDGYGDTAELPFFEKFYAGGIGSVRGFEPNSLGETYDLAKDGSDRPKGGSVKLTGTAALVFPVPFIEDSSNVRMSWFFDFGNVFDSLDNLEVGELRSSTGLGVSWITPVGPLSFSIAQPISYTSSVDKLQTFQFTLGGGF